MYVYIIWHLCGNSSISEGFTIEEFSPPGADVQRGLCIWNSWPFKAREVDGFQPSENPPRRFVVSTVKCHDSYNFINDPWKNLVFFAKIYVYISKGSLNAWKKLIIKWFLLRWGSCWTSRNQSLGFLQKSLHWVGDCLDTVGYLEVERWFRCFWLGIGGTLCKCDVKGVQCANKQSFRR